MSEGSPEAKAAHDQGDPKPAPETPPSDAEDKDVVLAQASPSADKTSPSAVSPTRDDQTVQFQQRRSAAHSKLRAYESKRRSAYDAKLQSSSLYWRAFRALMHDSLIETQKADILLRGWTHASEAYSMSMKSVGGWCIDERGIPVTDPKKKKKLIEHYEKGGLAAGAGMGVGSDLVNGPSMFQVQQRAPSASLSDKRGPFVGEDTQTEKCGTMIKNLADSASAVSSLYEENVNFMKEEVLPDLSSLQDLLKTEVAVMEKLGDSIMQELELAENEVCKAWESYYNKAVDFTGLSSDSIKSRRVGAQLGVVLDPNAAVEGCADVWVDEMRYRMAVAFLSSCWEKCSSELSKLFLSMKNTECERRNRIKELMIKATKRQGHLWQRLPSVLNTVLNELIEWPMERKLVEDDVQASIRSRAQSIQREEVEHKKVDQSKFKAPGLSGVDPREGNFELSSPLVSDLMCKAKVIEKRGAGMMSSWKVTLAVVTSDSFLQLFELPSSCKLQLGSAPEVAFQNLIPPVLVPTAESVKAGAKVPSSKNWFDNLSPSDSLALPNCVISFKDEKSNSAFEIVETVLTSGASKMFTKTINRKLFLRAVTRDAAIDLIEVLKKPE